MWPKQFRAIYRNAFKVCASDPFYLVISLASVMLMILAASMPSLGEDEHLRLVRDQTHSILFICGALASAFGLIRVVTDDLRRGAGSILMSRPVSPGILIAGKLIGVLMCVAVLFLTGSFAYLWISDIAKNNQELDTLSLMFYLLVILLSLLAGAARQYLFGSNFSLCSSVSLCAFMLIGVGFRLTVTETRLFDFQGLQSILLLFLAVASFCATVQVVAVLADSAMVLGLAIILFFFGLISSYLTSKFLGGDFGLLVSSILPNWQNYWILEALGQGEKIPLQYFLQIAFQTAIYVGMYTAISTALFERTEIKGNT